MYKYNIAINWYVIVLNFIVVININNLTADLKKKQNKTKQKTHDRFLANFILEGYISFH